MRKIIAAALLAGAGTGCCKTCSWCRDDAPPTASGSGYTTQPPRESPPVSGTGTATTPPAPAGRPVGAYGGTGTGN